MGYIYSIKSNSKMHIFIITKYLFLISKIQAEFTSLSSCQVFMVKLCSINQVDFLTH